MDWLQLLYDICELCLIPLIGVLTGYVIKYIRTKEAAIVESVDSELGDKYVAMLFDTIASCVTATTQTYVESLKKQDAFDAEAQKTAFNQTLNTVKAVLTDEAREYLSALYGDLDAFIAMRIEAEVKAQK